MSERYISNIILDAIYTSLSETLIIYDFRFSHFSCFVLFSIGVNGSRNGFPNDFILQRFISNSINP